MTAKELEANTGLQGKDHTLFTDEQIAKGDILLVGRTLDGHEMSVPLDMERPGSWVGTIRIFAHHLHRTKTTP